MLQFPQNSFSCLNIEKLTRRNFCSFSTLPGHLCLPYNVPTVAAAVSPTPIVNIPLINGNKLKPAELVISHGAGCSHNGSEKPTNKYIGVSANNPASFSSENTINPLCKC